MFLCDHQISIPKFPCIGKKINTSQYTILFNLETMIRFTLNGIVLIDGSKFIEMYSKNAPNFNIEQIRKTINPKVIDDSYLTSLGYKINTRATIFAGAKPTDVIKGWELVTLDDTNQDLFEAFFDLEIYNYDRKVAGVSSYMVPILDLLKFCYWYYMCSQIPESEAKLLHVKKTILGKSRKVKKYRRSSDSVKAYEDLINTAWDLYSEMMFAAISRSNGFPVTLNKTDDFVITNNIAEVKSIHDRIDRESMDKRSDSLLVKSLADSFNMNNLKQLIGHQITRNKWIRHLKKAIEEQEAEIVLINATQSQEMHAVSIFLEQEHLRKSFSDILKKCLSFVNEGSLIPVLVLLETIHERHIVTPFGFKVPIIQGQGSRQLDESKLSLDFATNNILL